MRKTKEQNSKYQIPNTNKGITLIALVITIIVMLILVAVTISMAVNGGLFGFAGRASGETQNAINAEQQLADGKIQVNGKWYASIDDYIAGKEIKQPYFGLTITTETEEVVYTDKDGNVKELTEEVVEGDIIQYGDYEYRYNSKYEAWWDDTDVAYFYNWIVNPEQDGWGVIAKDNTKSKYGELCGAILGKQVKVMENTFRNCTALTESPQIPESVTNMKETFYNCTALKEAPQVPNSVIDMYMTFYDCSSLTTTSIPDSLTILDYTFYGCSSLEKVSIPNNITTLVGAFGDCIALTSIEMPDSIEEIGQYTFKECSSLTDITIPNKVNSIGRNAFYRCEGLTNITIPEGVEIIDVYTFDGCTGLTNVTIPDTLKSIGYHAFCECISLKNIFIPSSVENIDHFAFDDCESNLIIYCEADVQQEGWDKEWNCYETNLKFTTKYDYTRAQYESEIN